jgi:hypothetical protein
MQPHQLERGKNDKGNSHKRYNSFPNAKNKKLKLDFCIFLVNMWLDFSFE